MFNKLCIVAILFIFSCLQQIEIAAFSPSLPNSKHTPLNQPASKSTKHATSTQQLDMSPQDDGSRRSFLLKQILIATTAATTILSSDNHPAFADTAVVLLMDKSNPDVSPFRGGTSEAKDRFRLAIQDIDSLLANYDEISKNGDNVRLYLGTQGVKSNMYGIMKVLKSLKEEADDIVEYTEALDEFEAYLLQAEGAAYQSMFVEHSSAKSTPESLLKTAKGDIINARKFMGDLAVQLNMS